MIQPIAEPTHRKAFITKSVPAAIKSFSNKPCF